jgi:predicted transposase YbfD/YdcC
MRLECGTLCSVSRRKKRRGPGSAQEVIAIDGKTLRRSFDRASGKSPLHLVSAWASGARLVLGQVATDEKSNEITAVPKLLQMLSLNGANVTADALNCQRTIASQVVAQDGDYVLALKGNQGTLRADVRLYLDDPAHAAALATSKPEVEGDHGRIETRQAFVCSDIGWLQEHHKWPGLAAAGKIVRSREIRGVTETTYYLLSTPLSPTRFAEVARAHCGIESVLQKSKERSSHSGWKFDLDPTRRRLPARRQWFGVRWRSVLDLRCRLHFHRREPAHRRGQHCLPPCIEQASANAMSARYVRDDRPREKRLADNPKFLFRSPSSVPLTPNPQLNLFRSSARTSLVRTLVRALSLCRDHRFAHGGQCPTAALAPGRCRSDDAYLPATFIAKWKVELGVVAVVLSERPSRPVAMAPPSWQRQRP